MSLPFVAPPGWWAGARCRLAKTGLEPFYSIESETDPFAICQDCLVRWQCLTDGLNELHGVWGGHTPRERKRLQTMIESGTTLKEASLLIEQRRQSYGR